MGLHLVFNLIIPLAILIFLNKAIYKKLKQVREEYKSIFLGNRNENPIPKNAFKFRFPGKILYLLKIYMYFYVCLKKNKSCRYTVYKLFFRYYFSLFLTFIN